jgi:crotonobetainyl-CoA:carnitine CoA-transferase CaiB-like acyl-CoA transferase
MVGTVLGRNALVPGPVLRMASYDGPLYDGVPGIGEHTASDLAELLGMSDEELAELDRAGVIGPQRVPA